MKDLFRRVKQFLKASESLIGKDVKIAQPRRPTPLDEDRVKQLASENQRQSDERSRQIAGLHSDMDRLTPNSLASNSASINKDSELLKKQADKLDELNRDTAELLKKLDE